MSENRTHGAHAADVPEDAEARAGVVDGGAVEGGAAESGAVVHKHSHAAEVPADSAHEPRAETPAAENAAAGPAPTESAHAVRRDSEGRAAAPVDKPAADTAVAENSAADNAAAEKPAARRIPLAVLVPILAVVVSLMLMALGLPAVHSGAKDLPLAVSGPAPAIQKIEQQLDAKQPGAFKYTEYDSQEDAADAIKNRDAIGGIAVTQKGVVIQTAAGAGAPYSAILKGMGGAMQAQGMKVTYQELAPFTADDPAGAAMISMALPIIFGGMISAVVICVLWRGPSLGRVIGSLSLAILAGLCGTLILRYMMHSIDHDFMRVWISVSAGIAAISLTVIGLESLLGYAGLGVGAVTMLFISNPLAGLTAGPDYLPHPWGAIGQFLPVGAAGTALRSAAYFDGRGATHAYVVLACWIALGIVWIVLGGLKAHAKRRKTARLEAAAA